MSDTEGYNTNVRENLKVFRTLVLIIAIVFHINRKAISSPGQSLCGGCLHLLSV